MNTIHKFTMAIVAVVMIVGFSAFKMSETKRATYWYTLEKINPGLPTTPDNMRIVDYLSGFTPPQSSFTACALENNGDLCHIGVDLLGRLPQDLVDMDVEDALALSGVSGEDYSKQP